MPTTTFKIRRAPKPSGSATARGSAARWLFVACFASLLCAATSVHSATLKVATVLPEGSAWMQQMRSGAKELEQRTEGRVKLKFYPGGVMGNARTVLRKMRAGQLHGGAFNSGALTDLYRETEIYSLPLLFRNHAEVDYVRARLDPAIREGLAKAGLVALALSDGGFAHLLSQRPIQSVGDLKETKLWILENDSTSRTALEFADVSPVPLPLSDVYTGLQTGLVDAVAAPPSAAIAFQWHAKVSFITDVPLMYLIGVLAFDERALAKLDDSDRLALEEVVADATRRLDRANRSADAEAMQALARQGVELVRVGEKEMKHWRSIADQTVAKLRSDGTYSASMLEAMLDHLDAYRHAQAHP